MEYQEPIIELIVLEFGDIVTLSVDNNSDEIIQDPDKKDSWAQ